MVQSPTATTVPAPGLEVMKATASCGLIGDGQRSPLMLVPWGPPPPATRSNAACMPCCPSMLGSSAQPTGRVTVEPSAGL
jgi:hypothetical protein